MADDQGKGTGEPGWTEQEKGPDASGRPPGDAGAAGEAVPKGRPSSDREATETAADRTDADPKR